MATFKTVRYVPHWTETARVVTDALVSRRLARQMDEYVSSGRKANDVSVDFPLKRVCPDCGQFLCYAYERCTLEAHGFKSQRLQPVTTFAQSRSVPDGE